jgi:hypothetical protein
MDVDVDMWIITAALISCCAGVLLCSAKVERWRSRRRISRDVSRACAKRITAHDLMSEGVD